MLSVVHRPANLAFGLSSNEMDASHHMAAVMEVDLRACQPNTLVDRINAVPAFKTSAAFFSFLRANLVLPHSEMSSNANTPVLGPVTHGNKGSSATTATTTTKSAPSGAAVNLDDIPPLTLGVMTSRADKVDALQLVADSIAQQRQTSSRSMVFHPLSLAGLAAGLGIAYKLNPRPDLGMTMTLLSGVVMTYLLSIRYFSAQYIPMAESLKWDWIVPKNDDGKVEPGAEEDTVIGARYGEEMIGALVLRLVPPAADEQGLSTSAAAPPPNTSRKKNNNKASQAASDSHVKGGHGVIRAWTTRLRYRRRGIGGDLLQEAIQVTRERCGKDANVVFAEAHANSVMVVPEMFNGPFRKVEQWAVGALERALANPVPPKKL
ncbi:acetyltransferase, GNAT family [Sporothrix schenckii 1099-18]|uniref:Acetyltransferase, GNAT family n=1 Tax=Sporothrix schenckii 1099-18 TaxID=1397361 RepID=A0A0F2M7Y4_SPOSC|nr:acetyltransferase, GNAT family [Sporothrix schenckii 1099-18]KJR85752.1 acetyltransferase, GNAT family [Sporothrix schenckii 1099-18]